MPPLPPLFGVDPCRQRLPAGPWRQLGDYLRDQFPGVAPEAWQERFAAGRAVDGQGARLSWDQPYPAGAELHYYRELPAEPPIPFAETILYQDDDLLVADKPPFLPVVPAGRFLRETLLIRLRQRTGLAELTPVHRLDRHTAGLVLFSCRVSSRDAYTALFRERQITKVYHALAPIDPTLTWPQVRRSRIATAEPFFCMAEIPGPPNAETRIQLLEQRGAEGLYRLEPLTGRKHQLRVHMAALGLPIRGDLLYPQVTSEAGIDDWSKPLQLLAQSLGFIDPLTGEPRRFASLQQLG
jgi:tRNA pseudouridine32 synthase/23S rRNA pseudouridine746 synthase